MEGVTVDRLQQRYDLSVNLLQKECTSEDIQEIALFLESWKLLAPRLGLKKEQIQAVDKNADSEEEKRVALLEKWKEKFAFMATYQRLIEAFLAIERADIACKVCETVLKSQTGKLMTLTL